MLAAVEFGRSLVPDLMFTGHYPDVGNAGDLEEEYEEVAEGSP